MIPSNGNSERNRRFIVTVLCIALATTLVMSITIYVDSESVDIWSEKLNTGPVSMSVAGDDVEHIVDDIAEIPGVTAVSGLNYSHGFLSRRNIVYAMEVGGIVYSLSDDYLNKFPTTFLMAQGRLPQNATEIAIPLKLASQTHIGLGWTLNFSNGPYGDMTLMTIVGLYEQSSWDLFSYYYYDSVAIITPDNLDPSTEGVRAYLSIDTSPISPFDADGAVAYLTDIEDSIRELDERYPEEIAFSKYSVIDFLLPGVRSYIEWRNDARGAQVSRASGVVLIVVLVILLAVRYNITNREKEAGMLLARGASQRYVEARAIFEMLYLSGVSTIVGVIGGILLSRFAMASDGYLAFSYSATAIDALLITRESVIIALIVGLAIPLLAYVAIKASEAGTQVASTETGRLGKFAKGLSLLQWDILVLGIALMLIFAFYTSGPLLQDHPVFLLALPYLPIPVFVAAASLVIKGITRFSDAFSGPGSKILGKAASLIGIRRIGRLPKTNGIIVMLMVLAITLSWNNAVMDATLPETRLNHARFAIGSDMLFHLNKGSIPDWDQFIENATEQGGVIGATLVSEKRLFLSTGYSGAVDFVMITPSEFSFIGYDYSGRRLNDTRADEWLQTMSENPSAIVMTSDLADRYRVSVGDTIRAFNSGEMDDFFTFTIIGITGFLTQPLIPESTFIPLGSGYKVGSSKIWVNREYIAESIDLDTETYTYLSVGCMEGVNATEIAMTLLESGGEDVIYTNDWTTVNLEFDSYINTVAYQLDRSVDSMMTVGSALIVLGVLTVYGLSNTQGRRRETALLRIMGADSKAIVRIHLSEFLAVIAMTLMILAGYAPLFISNSMSASLNAYRSWAFIFPVTAFPVIPWIPLMLVIAFNLAAILIFAAVLSIRSSKVRLSEALASSWALGGPKKNQEVE